MPFEDDQFSFQYISKKSLEFERSLFQTKWFDYRQFTPAQATRHYLEAYADVCRTVFSIEVDKRAAEFIQFYDVDKAMRGLAAQNPHAKAAFSGAWRGRQVADAIGMPYKDYIRWAMHFRMRRWSNTRNLPRPAHLYHEWDVEKVQAKWEELQASNLYLSDDPAFLVQNYCGIAYQNDYHEWLFKQAALRPDEFYFLAQFINEDRLPIEKVQARLTQERFERVKSYLH